MIKCTVCMKKKMLRSASSERAILVAKVSHQYLITYDFIAFNLIDFIALACDR